MIPDGFYMVNFNIMICFHVDDISLKNQIKYKYIISINKINICQIFLVGHFSILENLKRR